MPAIGKVCKTTVQMAEMTRNEHRLLVLEKKLHLLSDLMLTMHHNPIDNPTVHTPSTSNLAPLPEHSDALSEADILAALRRNSSKLDRANGKQHTGHSATSPSATEETDDETDAHSRARSYCTTANGHAVMQHPQLQKKTLIQSKIDKQNTKAVDLDLMQTVDQPDQDTMQSRNSATPPMYSPMPVSTANKEKTPIMQQPLSPTPQGTSPTTKIQRQVVQQGSGMLGGRAERRVTNNPYVRHIPRKFRNKVSNKHWLVEFQINLGRLYAKTNKGGLLNNTGGLLKLQHKFHTNAEAQAWRNSCLERHGVQLVINSDGYWEQVPLEPL